MMWRRAIISSVLHGGLLIGLVGNLPIQQRIFDRYAETESTELLIAVNVVSVGALNQLADAPGLRDAAPGTEAAVPPPALAIELLAPQPVTPPLRPPASPGEIRPRPAPSPPC
jgi:hypothetical protein